MSLSPESPDFVIQFRQALLCHPVNTPVPDAWVMALFHYQAQNNPVYGQFIAYLGVDPTSISQITDIPFLPIELFKTQKILTDSALTADRLCFESSRTTGQTASRHEVPNTGFYEQISQLIFEAQYGALTGWHILALLPSYLERGGSSLVYMVQHFIGQSQSPLSGFFLHDTDALLERLGKALADKTRRTLLIGVSFALLDLAEAQALDLAGVVVMETGGMKGRRAEITRQALHQQLQRRFNTDTIHSEYGMTELLSQAYSQGQGIFTLPHSMRVLIREPNDPFSYQALGRSGALNIIDLANIESCAFIATQDLGQSIDNQSFSVLGRMDNSDIRGCNLMVSV
ncbi:acyl transferase [Eisenibacter elegans]|jgi:phenylacetate-coenzyme A ligase PaaK-like adenylate-forming protein|uniref:acyl transferase n=1 Tax=Eisenibacter elegans TaxID=997 RepID=UPI0003F9F7A3|nr:acyl transferase [Eisenibacter elegans]